MKTYKNIFYISVIALGIYFVASIFFSSISYNVNTPNHTFKMLFNLSVPEGWGFFTRSPREDIVDLYTINNGELKKVLHENGDMSNFFGSSRKSRKIGMETSIILSRIQDSLWHKQSDLEHIKIPEVVDDKIDNENLFYLTNGDFVLIKRKTTPWAWKENINLKNIPYEITRIKTE